MMNDSNKQNQTDSDSDEQTVQYLREIYSQIGLCSNVNQSSCLDSAFEFNFILPRIFLPTCQEELSVKASTFIGTAHFWRHSSYDFYLTVVQSKIFVKQDFLFIIMICVKPVATIVGQNKMTIMLRSIKS